MALKLNFKLGKRYSLPSQNSMQSGEVYFATDGNYGQIWYKDSDGKRLNVVPEVLDGGAWTYIHYPDCCFVSGTKILLDLNGTTKNIEEIQENDIVVSYNVLTNNFYNVKVKKLVVNKNSLKMAKVYFDNGLTLEMTEYHPLFTKNGFHSLTNHKGYDTLMVNDEVKTIGGWSKIVKIDQYQLEKPIITYNLDIINLDEVSDDDTNDTFIANGFVAHNAACPT